jgi:hypothetical protein
LSLLQGYTLAPCHRSIVVQIPSFVEPCFFFSFAVFYFQNVKPHPFTKRVYQAYMQNVYKQSHRFWIKKHHIPINTYNMKLTILFALLAISAATVSASNTSGPIYVYANSMDHPKTTFVKKGSKNQVVTDGAACKGKNTLSGKSGALSGTFTEVTNQWDFNGEHDNEIRMGKSKR